MLDPSPRPLPHNRLERIMHGLRTRIDNSSKQIENQSQQLTQSLVELSAKNEIVIETVNHNYSSQHRQLITDWDEAIQDHWDHSEARTYASIFGTQSQEAKLRSATRHELEELTKEAKSRVSEIERRFLAAKDIPVKKLKETKTHNNNLHVSLQQVAQAADAFLAQHSLRQPNTNTPELSLDSIKNSAAALEKLKQVIADATHHQHRLANHPVTKLLGSIWWWLFCGLLLLVVPACLVLAKATTLLPAIVIGSVATGAVLLAGVLGVRPFLKKVAAVEYPKIKHQVQLGRKIHQLTEKLAIDENDQELKRLAAKRDTRFQQICEWRDKRNQELKAQLEQEIAKLREHALAEKHLAANQLTSSTDETNQRFLHQETEAEARFTSQLKELSSTLESEQTSLKEEMRRSADSGTLRLEIASEKAHKITSRNRRWCEQKFPAWETLTSDLNAWSSPLARPMLPLGSVGLSGFDNSATNAPFDLQKFETQFLYSPIDDQYLTIHGDAAKSFITGFLRNLILRALSSLPPGRTQICVIDPPGLGRDFGWLMQLGDFDPTLVNHRVWTQQSHIAQQIQKLAHAAEDFIQQSLRNQYRDIASYNQDAGAMAEPYRFLIWTSLPHGLDDQSWKSLQSLLDSGARCGIFPILVVDPSAEWPNANQRELLERRGLHLMANSADNSMKVNGEKGEAFNLSLSEHANEQETEAIVREVGRRALTASRVEVPLESMLPPANERWHGDSSNALEIPVGQSGVGRIQSLKLGVGTAQHALIAGKTGSGKSSLLHAIITSAALKYSPEQLRMTLLDFKKGVEFQVYSDAKLPHADIIGIESHREFGLSALEYLDKCMQSRGEAFRNASVQDVASWNLLHPDQSMPRILVIIDEFQELFVEEDKLSGQANMILDRIVRQGRSFGVHAVLSSQTLAGAYSLPRTTLGQMAVRIALQCDASDAQVIFAEDNPAAARLKHPGQAVYNDAGGRIEGNQSMQVGWMDKGTQTQLLSDLPAGFQNSDLTTNRLGHTVVFDGNRAATWDVRNAELSIANAQREINPDATWCIIGESVAINPAVSFPLTSQTGRNILLVGADDEQAASTILSITASVLRRAVRSGPAEQGSITSDDTNGPEQQNAPEITCQLFTIQGAKPTDQLALQLPDLFGSIASTVGGVSHETADNRSADETLKTIYDELQKRIGDDEGTGHSTILLNLLQLGRLRSLRNEDEFGMGGFGESELSADKHLEEILRDGPSNGIHTLIWADSYSVVNRWLSRNALREIEIRMLMQMSANDSTNLTDTVAASKLGDHVMLLFDEATGQEQKFRPFNQDSLKTLPSWIESRTST